MSCMRCLYMKCPDECTCECHTYVPPLSEIEELKERVRKLEDDKECDCESLHNWLVVADSIEEKED